MDMGWIRDGVCLDYLRRSLKLILIEFYVSSMVTGARQALLSLRSGSCSALMYIDTRLISTYAATDARCLCQVALHDLSFQSQSLYELRQYQNTLNAVEC